MKLGKFLKRCSLMLLSGIFVLSSCVGGNDVSEESQDVSDTVSSDTSEGRHTLISVGKPYTTSAEPNQTYTDLFGQQITDGLKAPDEGTFYTDIRMVGFTSTCRFDIDLGEDGKNINAIAARSLDVSRDGVLLASGVVVYGSNDAKEWQSLGHTVFRSSGDCSVSTAYVELKECVDYRYIRVSVTIRSGSHFFFVDEIEVYADVEPKENVSTLAASYDAEDIDRNAWKAVSTGKAVNFVVSDNIALGKSYTLINATADPRAEEAYNIAKNMPVNTTKPKFDTMITDGARTGRMFGERVWTGITADSESSVLLDLGSLRKDIYRFSLYMLGSGKDVEFPDYVDVYASDDNKSFTLLGRMYAPAGGDCFAYTLILPEYIHARYIRFDLPKGNTNYWIEEAEVYAGLDELPESELYPAVTYPVVTEELKWDTSEKDYKVRQNLLLGRTQQVASSYYMSDSVPATDKKQTAWNSPVITDGERAPDSYCYSSGWFYHYGGGAIDFFFDLEKTSSLDSVTVNYLEHRDWGVSHPNYITVFLSDDANNWYPIQTEHITSEASPTAKYESCTLEFDKAYAARFLRVRIESAVLFVDEIEAFGTKQVTSSTVKLSESGIEPVIYYTNEGLKTYATTDNTSVKAKDIMLVFGEKGGEDDLLPLVAYLDADGNIVDTFMDGFVYCPTGALPSGAQAHLAPVKQDWDYLFDNTYNGINGLDKLETVVQQVKDALNKPDYKVQVYITILYPSYTVTDFGDIDGDGVTESLETAEGRRKILDWYINRCLTEFDERAYKNLEFGGFYWINEAVTWGNDDSELIKEISKAVHDADSYLLWIPYYNANRYYLGYELGFDLVCMQPNYAFTLDKPLYNFTATARRMELMHMCVEIENSYQSLADPMYARNYMLYLYYGVTMGYIDAIHIYYDDIDNYSTMAYSDREICRMQYDATYMFAKGTLEITPEKLADASFTGKAGEMLYGSLKGDDELVMFSLVTAPKHGYVSLGDDGSFVYYPEKGYTGADSFTYTYNRYLGESEPCSVNITIE